MTDPQTEIAELANAFIHLANARLTESNHTQVAMALLAASARFNAYIVAMGSGSPEQARADATENSAYLVQHFQRTLAANLEDYIQNFGAYAAPSPGKSPPST